MKNAADHFKEVRETIDKLAVSCGKKPEDIRLVTVTKTVPPSVINSVIEAGASEIGENRVQELLEKYDDLLKPPAFQVHLIGHLQSNKVKYIVDKVSLIHSVDSLHLAKEIDRQCGKIGKVMDILIQVNVAGDENKFGIRPDQLDPLLCSLGELKNISVQGLMTIPKLNVPEAETRESFRALYKLFVDTKAKKYDNINMNFLSMGMSSDYKIAIQEGANMVRIGTSIFGKRDIGGYI